MFTLKGWNVYKPMPNICSFNFKSITFSTHQTQSVCYVSFPKYTVRSSDSERVQRDRAVQIHYFKVFLTRSNLVDVRSQDLYTILIEEHQSNWLISILIVQNGPLSAISNSKFDCQRVNNAINNKQQPTSKQQPIGMEYFAWPDFKRQVLEKICGIIKYMNLCYQSTKRQTRWCLEVSCWKVFFEIFEWIFFYLTNCPNSLQTVEKSSSDTDIRNIAYQKVQEL